jgi:alpha-tubulin suppressor-like RCC1 family protein
LALTESGCVYSWGDNSRGALGFENIEKSNTPKQIEIKDNFIDKITCGAFHCLLLTKNGDIFAFGSNNFGQVGNGMIGKNQFKPEKVNHENIFIDIAAHFDESISIALSFDNTY